MLRNCLKATAGLSALLARISQASLDLLTRVIRASLALLEPLSQVVKESERLKMSQMKTAFRLRGNRINARSASRHLAGTPTAQGMNALYTLLSINTFACLMGVKSSALRFRSNLVFSVAVASLVTSI